MHLFPFDPWLGVEPILLDGTMIRPALDDSIKQDATKYLPEKNLPSLLHSDGSPVVEVNSFITFLRSDGVSLASAGHYARDLQVFARYLRDARSKSLLDASSADVGKYRSLRLEGPGELRLSGSSWKRTSAALTRFYQWAASEDAGLISVAPKTRFRRDGAVAEDTIRMIPLEDYVLFRDQACSVGVTRTASLTGGIRCAMPRSPSCL